MTLDMAAPLWALASHLRTSPLQRQGHTPLCQMNGPWNERSGAYFPGLRTQPVWLMSSVL